MKTLKVLTGMIMVVLVSLWGCSSMDDINGSDTREENVMVDKGPAANAALPMSHHGGKGALTANGWYEEQEIYYIHNGIEEGVSQRGENDIYLIGGDRVYQANVVEFVPGEKGYSPHWNVYLVNTAPGKTLADILASPYKSDHYPEALFDDVEDLRAAKMAGLVTFTRPGIVVNCPIVSEKAADAPGNTALSESFSPFPSTF